MKREGIVAGLVALLAIVLVALAAGYWLVMHMPGVSYRGTPPPLDAEGQALRERLRGHVLTLSQRIGERHVWRPETLRETASYIERQWRDAGLDPIRQPVPVCSTRFDNIEVRLAGTGTRRATLVIGAHYDTVRGTPGADDNASGVAILLEVARRLQGRAFDHPVHLVAFVNEEEPFFGSRAMGSLNLARRLRDADEEVLGMISLEMLGYYSDAPGSQRYPPLVGHFYPDTGNFVAGVGNLGSRAWVRRVVGALRRHATLPTEGLAAPVALVGDIRRSDHWAFWTVGYPAMMLTDTADFRTPYYHGPDDTPETLNYDAMARLTEALIAAIIDLATQ